MDGFVDNQRGSDPILPRFFRALIDAGALTETDSERFITGDVSTGVGMLTALARLGMIQSSESDGTLPKKSNWKPSWISITRNAAMSGEKYIVSNNNRTLFDTIKNRLTGEPGRMGEIYLVTGGSGMGKSHMLAALSENTNRTCRLINVMDFDVELEVAVRKRERAELFGWLLDAEVLLLDDIHCSRENNNLQNALRHIITAQQSQKGIVVVTSRKWSGDPVELDQDLWDLIKSGTPFTLALPNESERREILRVHFGESIPPDALQYLARNVSESMRQLMNAANQLVNLSRQTETTITKDMARAVLPLPQDLLHRTSKPPTATTMLSDVGFENANGDRAHFFREILSSAENEEEQTLALQIAIGQRLRELKEQENTEASVAKMEKALSLLRDGKMEEAIKSIAS